jgi:hypothetical protein
MLDTRELIDRLGMHHMCNPSARHIDFELKAWRPGNAYVGTYEYHMQMRREHIQIAKQHKREGNMKWVHNIACARVHNYAAAVRKHAGIHATVSVS